MIHFASGRIDLGELSIARQDPVGNFEPWLIRSTALGPAQGWRKHLLGLHEGSSGWFEVEIVSTPEDRVQLVLLSHRHLYYRAGDDTDRDRRAFHEGMIERNLGGRRELGWGKVWTQYDERAGRDWIVVMYASGPLVSRPEVVPLLFLFAHADPEAGR